MADGIFLLYQVGLDRRCVIRDQAQFYIHKSPAVCTQAVGASSSKAVGRPSGHIGHPAISVIVSSGTRQILFSLSSKITSPAAASELLPVSTGGVGAEVERVSHPRLHLVKRGVSS